MKSKAVMYGTKGSRSDTSGMPSFISQIPVSNPMGTEGNNTNAFRMSDLGVFDQYLGFRIGDGANVNRSPLFNSTSSTNPAVDFDVSGSINKSLAPLNISMPTPLSQAMQLQKGLQSNLVSGFGTHHENWGVSNIAESSSRTDSSTDMDGDDKYQRIEMGLSSRATVASDLSNKSKEEVLDQKSLRRLAQNREASRKSRLKKKAYVQHLENSMLKLYHLEQELQQARKQGRYISSMGDQPNGGVGVSGPLAFGVEYSRWLEEHNKRINELRTAVNSRASDVELQSMVDSVTAHFDEIFRAKGNAVKADVFLILSGMWKTPAERCFLWIGGFRPSELLKLLVNQFEPLTGQQLGGIYNLYQSSNQAEYALSQGMEALQQSLAETLANGSLTSEGSSGDVANYMGQMAMAMGKLGTLEAFVRQADNLRQQTLQQMHSILTTRQSARALLAMNEYFSRLRVLSSLWLARTQEQ